MTFTEHIWRTPSRTLGRAVERPPVQGRVKRRGHMDSAKSGPAWALQAMAHSTNSEFAIDRWLSGRKRRFAKRHSAFGTVGCPGKSNSFNEFPDRVNWLSLAREALFWALAGTIVGTAGVAESDSIR